VKVDPRSLRERRRNQLRKEWEQFGFFPLTDANGVTLSKCFHRAVEEGGFELEKFGVRELNRLGIEGDRATGICQINTGKIFPPSLDAEELTNAQIRCRKAAYYVLNNLLRPFVPGFKNAVIVSTASDLGIRTSRRIQAEYCPVSWWINEGREISYEPYPDVVGVFNPFQHRNLEIAYRTLIPLNVENLLVASGRSYPSIGGSNATPWREGGATILIGQAAGVAAALCVQTGHSPRNLPTRELQKKLLEQGVYLGDKKRLTELALV
jgi:hypothetical protein